MFLKNRLVGAIVSLVMIHPSANSHQGKNTDTQRRLPDREATQDFIRENLIEEKSKVSDISCSALVVSREYDESDRGGLHRATITIPLRDVNFTEDELSKELDLNGIKFTCNSGRCISYKKILPISKTEMHEYIVIGSIIDMARVAKALRHLQTICGGPRETAF